MDEDEESLLMRMKELALQRGYSWVKCLTEEELAQAEALLGFPLPLLLKRIYLEVGEGAFGLSPLSKEHWTGLEMPLVESYIGFRSESGVDEKRECNWPEKLLFLYDWGCNIYSCVDCASAGQRVVRNDTNRDPDAYALEAPSLQQWLQALLDGVLLHFDWDTAEKVPF